MELNSLYTELILEHNSDKRNKRLLEAFTNEERGHNPSCGDEITIQAEIADGYLKDIGYSGHGCAISQASASMMIDLLKGKKVEEALETIEVFLGMIKREISDLEYLEETLEDAFALQNISNMPARVKCAVLAWHTLKEAVKK